MTLTQDILQLVITLLNEVFVLLEQRNTQPTRPSDLESGTLDTPQGTLLFGESSALPRNTQPCDNYSHKAKKPYHPYCSQCGRSTKKNN